jgi:uncharacterized Zn-finger protein
MDAPKPHPDTRDAPQYSDVDPNAPPLRDKAVVEVGASDLAGPQALYCPNPKMPLWSNHPRVFLDIGKTGRTMCPYCGTIYVLNAPG